jgi:RNA polymerase sigma-70 factor, ECF subfamily
MMRVRNNPKNLGSLSLENSLDCGNQQQWSKLLEEIAQGDQSALTSLYNDTRSVVFGLILRIVDDRAIAEEVLLDVFSQVWREATIYDARCLQPLTWLLKIARLRALDCLRSGKCKNDFKNPISEDSPIEAPQDESQQVSFITQQQRLARAALASLSSSQRAVIELAYYHGLSQSEIALRLGLSPETVKINIRLAMMKLHEFLNPVLQEQL